MDEHGIERAIGRYRLALPSSALGDRVGNLSSAQAGSSLELQDFREYQPGDDLRHVDWNAVARTGKVFLRVRRDEVAPRVEVLVDASRSMAVSEEKRERARELGALFGRLADVQGLALRLFWLGASPRQCEAPLEKFDGVAPLGAALARVPLSRSGVRLVVSDFLFEEPLGPLVRRLAEGVGLLGLIQVLDEQDESPSAGGVVRLVDSETGASLERSVDTDAIERYLRRLAAHRELLENEARRVRAVLCGVSASKPLEEQLRERLAGRLLLARAAV